MTKILHCCYNMDTNCVELTFNDGSVLSIDCEEVENAYDVTTRQMTDLDWLLYTMLQWNMHSWCSPGRWSSTYLGQRFMGWKAEPD